MTGLAQVLLIIGLMAVAGGLVWLSEMQDERPKPCLHREGDNAASADHEVARLEMGFPIRKSPL